MFVLVMSPDEYSQEFVTDVSENEIGEVTVFTTYNVEDAMVFETEEDALEFKRDFELRAWTYEV